MDLDGYTATGPREANEDNFYVSSFSSDVSFPNGIEAFALVSDGMGGYQGGDVASATVVKQADNYLQQLREMAQEGPIDLDATIALNEIVERSHAAILSEAEHMGRNMGATFVGIFISSTHVWIGHVGDSRAYLIRDGQATQLTEDHSQVGRMLARGLITEEEAQSHPERNKIEQALGFTVNETTIDEIDLHPNDVILLCSDGIYTALNNEKIAALIHSAKGALYASEKVVKAALSAGTDDNSTAVVAFPGRQPAKKRTGTLSEADRRKPVSPRPRHGKSASLSGKRYDRTSGSYRHDSANARTRAATKRPLRSVLIPLIAGLVLFGVIAVVAFNAFNSSQGSIVSDSIEQGANVAPEGAEVSSPSGNSAQEAASTEGDSQPQAPSASPDVLGSPKVVCYIDMRGLVREFSDKENGLKSPDLILSQGKSVLMGSGVISGDDGKQYIYLNDSYTADLLNDVRLYEGGERTFASAFSQLFDPNSYLRTVEGISSFFASVDTYGIEQEITYLVILEDDPQPSSPNESDVVSNEVTQNDSSSDSANQEVAQSQNQQANQSQAQGSLFGGGQEGV